VTKNTLIVEFLNKVLAAFEHLFQHFFAVLLDISVDFSFSGLVNLWGCLTHRNVYVALDIGPCDFFCVQNKFYNSL